MPDSSVPRLSANRSAAPLDGVRRAFAEVPGDPFPGEVWRARWSEVAQIVLVVATHEACVTAIPLNPDVDLIDDRTVIVDARKTVVQQMMAAWTSLATVLPLRVLETRLGRVSDQDLARALTPTETGTPITHALDERSQVHAYLADRVSHLAAATWLLPVTELVDVRTLMTARGLTPSTLANAAGLRPGEVIEFLRGDHRPALPVIARLASAIGVDAHVLQNQPVDPDLVRALDQPRFRRRLAERGAEIGQNDEGAWRYHVATTQLASAARTTGDTDPYQRWVGLIETYLA